MKTIKVYWTDAEMVDHEFYMEVPANEKRNMHKGYRWKYV